jgi:hypothetical protein
LSIGRIYLFSIGEIFSAIRLQDTPYKKVRKFPVPSRDVTTKLSLGGNNDVITELFLPMGSLVSDIPAGDGKLVNLFSRCIVDRIGKLGKQLLMNIRLINKINWPAMLSRNYYIELKAYLE